MVSFAATLTALATIGFPLTEDMLAWVARYMGRPDTEIAAKMLPKGMLLSLAEFIEDELPSILHLQKVRDAIRAIGGPLRTGWAVVATGLTEEEGKKVIATGVRLRLLREVTTANGKEAVTLGSIAF